MGKKPDRSSRGEAGSAGGVRGARLEELLREELTSLLDTEINDQRLADVHITRVELSGDGSRARAWFALKGPHETARVHDVTQAFERAAGFLRGRLCDALPMKRMPDLKFRHDPVALDIDAIR